MNKNWNLIKEEVGSWEFAKRYPHENESEEEYSERVYEEARIVFHQMIEDIESKHPNISDDDSLDEGEYWYDEFTEDAVQLIFNKLSVY